MLHGLCAFYIMQTLTLNSEIPQFWQPWNCFTSLFTSTCSSLLDKLCDNQREKHKLRLSMSIAVYIYISVLWTTTTHCLCDFLTASDIVGALKLFCHWMHHCMCAFHFNLFILLLFSWKIGSSIWSSSQSLEHFFICFIRSTVILVKWPLVCLYICSKCIQKK